ncbi:hypothetical protein M2145_002743 [Lachnospiraceae bacterium PF1-21]|uniref:hypothetical protein n=1 Tax=Ohessyouella blattaphilus TaxID=2949333 RepID=UPI00256273B3|nr:hypothetical protein [Lachnospiraceae bacterium OttesenSCG-928-J05]
MKKRQISYRLILLPLLIFSLFIIPGYHARGAEAEPEIIESTTEDYVIADSEDEVDLEDPSVPLGSFNATDHWSLINLTFAILSVLGSVILISRSYDLLIPSTSQGEDHFAYRYSELNAPIDSVANDKTLRRFTFLRLLAIIVGWLMLVLFILVEDLSSPMAWINDDTWKASLIFLLFLTLVSLHLLENRRRKKELENQQK